MAFSHILITRPREEAQELADQLGSGSGEPIILPAYEFHQTKLFTDHIAQLSEAAAGPHRPLLVFTSTRAVEYGLPQLPPETVSAALVAAIGPATAAALQQAGVNVSLRPAAGFTSEDLLDTLSGNDVLQAGAPAYILAAPGGRTQLQDSLKSSGHRTTMLMVYTRKPAEFPAEALGAIEQAPHLLAVWTSANSMNALSQRLPARCWYRLCRGEWLVISERLVRVARAFSPAKIHLASGPGNTELLNAIQALD